MADPAAIPWGTFAVSGATTILGIIAAVAGLLRHSVNQQKRIAGKDREIAALYKAQFKGEQLARERRLAEMETALFGRPSERPHEKQDTIAMLEDSLPKQSREEELQRRMLEERARELPRADPLEAFAPGPSIKDRLPTGAGRTDYDERRQRNAQQGFDTPTAYRPRQTTHRDEETPREPVGRRKP